MATVSIETEGDHCKPCLDKSKGGIDIDHFL